MVGLGRKYSRSIVWLRRDLRLSDNVCLLRACESSGSVCLAFVVNPALLAQDRMGSPLVCVFFEALAQLRADLRERGSDLAVLVGDFAEQLAGLARRIDARAVFFNEDYEPEARTRDDAVARHLESLAIAVDVSLDHVYFGAHEVERSADEPYRVFTPYKRRWLEQRAVSPRLPVPSAPLAGKKLLERDTIGETARIPAPSDFGFTPDSRFPKASERIASTLLQSFLKEGGPVERYREIRNFPALAGTSYLSPQLRSGTIGIRTCVEAAFAKREAAQGPVRENIDVWLSELIWRDFYQMILARFPRVVNEPFIVAAKHIPWRTPGRAFDAWCSGETGYPIVDAAMRQLNETGWMHNRLRMIVASFLTKHLLIDWRLGERYFERHLADADVAQNNGGWQWASSTGTDAAPYFRVFNPAAQSRRFDPDGTFIRTMLPALKNVPSEYVHEPCRMPPLIQTAGGITLGRDYPLPIVDHAEARARAIAVFKAALQRRA